MTNDKHRIDVSATIDLSNKKIQNSGLTGTAGYDRRIGLACNRLTFASRATDDHDNFSIERYMDIMGVRDEMMADMGFSSKLFDKIRGGIKRGHFGHIFASTPQARAPLFDKLAHQRLMGDAPSFMFIDSLSTLQDTDHDGDSLVLRHSKANMPRPAMSRWLDCHEKHYLTDFRRTKLHRRLFTDDYGFIRDVTTTEVMGRKFGGAIDWRQPFQGTVTIHYTSEPDDASIKENCRQLGAMFDASYLRTRKLRYGRTTLY